MHFRQASKFHFTAVTCVVISMMFAAQAPAAEKSLWQRFVSFFDPSPTVEGEGPEYDELRALDEKISKTEGKYSRERRPGNKDRIKKELEALREQRDKLAEEIEKKEKAAASGSTEETAASITSSSSAVAASSNASAITTASSTKTETAASTTATEAAVAISSRQDTVFVHDTITIHDTVTVHDTLYVIVAGPQSATSAAPAPAANQDSTKANAP